MSRVVGAVKELNLNATSVGATTSNAVKSVDNQTNSDTKSEISSCLDSSYESDNNAGGATSLCLSDEQENNRMASSHSMLLPKESTVGTLERQITITNSRVLTNSDDSDVTVNEAPLTTKKKDEQQKSSSFIDLTEKDTSKESCNSPCKTPTPAEVSFQQQFDDPTNQTNKNDENDNDNNNKIKPPSKTFMRMNSDGYCSSCTPLSASSINNESPNNNPFFQASANGGAAENVAENDAKDLHF